ncbi:MAG TPA: avidin/streptavidin family protein [Thermoanaerobaculia bacterium]|nr:avidin/streptavidin family protein [Thermoanaerobaculia bacterium]
MSVTGNWINGYGSVMFLTQAADGSVTGVYTSTTGSSGAYWVAGFANPNDPPSGNGQTLAFSILWRSFSGGAPDPSWHYVSGMSGQRLPLDPVTNGPTLVMIHDMVATVPFPELGITVPGSYIDKLIYVPYSGGQQSPGQWPPPFTPPASDPVDGNWQCAQNPSISLSITVQDETTGYVTGTLRTAGGTVNVVGFTDTGAGPTTPLQGLTLSALLPDGETVVALAGSLDLRTKSLSMTWLQSDGTAANATYLQTTFEGLTFKRA